MTDHASQGAPLASAAGTAPSRRWVVRVVAGVLVLATLVAVLWWQLSPRPPVQQPADLGDEVAEPVVSNPGYLGPQVCGSCHASRLAEFQKTRHFRACWQADVGPMPSAFTPEGSSYAAHAPGLRFQMTRSGNDFTETLIRETPAGEKRHSFHIDLVYGSGGRADEVFFTWKGDRLHELPVGWLHPQQQWGEQPFNPHDPGDLSRTTTPRCIECHNTWLGHVPGTANQYRREDMILGVTCEKCHGPAREHVAYHREHPDEQSGKAVVRPDRLTRDRQMDVCGQCHSNALRPRGPTFRYRPGEPLDAHFRSLVAPGLEKEHVADQVRHLRQSKCFQKSDTLTCTTCHDPHRPTDQAALGRSCLQCHQPADCGEHASLPTAVRGRCVECHMPPFNRVEVQFHTEAEKYVFPARPHQHRIAVYPAAGQEALLTWYRTRPDAASRHLAARLTDSLVAHWLAEGERLQRGYWFRAGIGAIREAVRLNPGSDVARMRLKEAIAIQEKLDEGLFAGEYQADERRYAEAIESLEGVLKVKPNSAKAHGKLGTLYAVVGQQERAVEHLRAVAEHDPDDPYGYNMLGWLAYLRGDGEGAVAAFRQADEVSPFTAEINHRWGLALLLLSRWTEADTRFRRVLEIDPKHAGACQGLSQALSGEGQLEEALSFALRAARLSRFQNADVLLTLADAYAAVGRWADAEETANRALDAAMTGNPHLAPRIRDRLGELRVRSKQGPR